MDPTNQAPDELLVLESQQGDAAAFDQLVRRWQQPLLSFAFRLTGSREAAQDAVQETWMVVIQGLVGLHDIARFRPWLFRIASNKCQDHWRRSHRSRHLAEELQQNAPPSAAPAPAGAPLDVEEAFRRLSPESRTVLALMYLEDFNVGEIAEILSLPEGTVKSRLFHARQQLRQLMEK